MAVFEQGKNVTDIQEGELLPEDWTIMEILDEPKRMENKVMKAAGADADKAGYNIVLRLGVHMPDLPEFHHREFTIWLSEPAVGDDSRYNPRDGMSIEDTKIKRNAEISSAFCNEKITGSAIYFEKGQQAMFYIVQKMDDSGTKLVNDINIFAGAKAVPTEH